jgi:dihydroneopterin aldolase
VFEPLGIGELGRIVDLQVERLAKRLSDRRLELHVSDAALSDRVEDSVDYRHVAACVREVSDGRYFHLLEALAAAVADAIVERFAVDRVKVRVRKRDPKPSGLAVAFAAATVERP